MRIQELALIHVLTTCGRYHHRRENTVLRGQLFERYDDDPSTLSVSRNVYVIPNALVADQFKPSPPKSTETSKD